MILNHSHCFAKNELFWFEYIVWLRVVITHVYLKQDIRCEGSRCKCHVYSDNHQWSDCVPGMVRNVLLPIWTNIVPDWYKTETWTGLISRRMRCLFCSVIYYAILWCSNIYKKLSYCREGAHLTLLYHMVQKAFRHVEQFRHGSRTW